MTGIDLPRNGRLPFLILLLMVAAVIFGPLFFPHSYDLPGELTYAPPSWSHLCGTDLDGRDLLIRILEGGRISLLVGLCGARCV